MSKFINFLIFFFSSLILTGCSYDDMPWDGIRNTDDEIAIAFCVQTEFSVTQSTRGSEVDAGNTVNTVDLIVFTGGSLLNHKQFTVSGDNQFVTATRADFNTNGVQGNWYLVANAGNLISDFAKATNFNRSELDFLQLHIDEDTAFKGIDKTGNSPIMFAKQQMSTPAANSSASIFELKKLYSKISLKVDAKVENYLVKQTRFYAEDTKVSVVGTPSSIMAEITGFHTPQGSNLKETTVDGSKYQYLKPGGVIDFYVLPMGMDFAKAENASDYSAAYKYPDPRILIQGRRIASRDLEDNISYDPEDTYYAYEFPQEIEAGHWYVLTLENVTGQGPSNADAAFDEPVGTVIKFEDKTESVNNFVTDGERVIGVQDNLLFEAESTNSTDLVNQTLTVYWRGKTNDDITYDPEVIPDWITGISQTTSTDTEALTNNSESGLNHKKTVFSFTVKKNEGSEREFIWPFYFVAKTSLGVETTVRQNGSNTKAQDLFDITIELKRGNSTEFGTANVGSDYFAFLEQKVKGVSSTANGGRIRDNGLHSPMPNSEEGAGVEYIYRIKPKPSTGGTWKIIYPSGLSVVSEGNGWKITMKDGEYPIGAKTIAAYEVFKDGIKIYEETTKKTLALDIYHTGFFNKVSDNDFRYYEVINVGGTYWLDRNVGATSSGMAHLAGGSYLSGQWPIDEDSAGDYVTYEDASKAASSNTVCPKGFRLPSQGDFEKLALQRTFSSDRLQSGSSTIFVPNYRLTYNEYRNNKPTPTVVAMYFPHNLYKKGSVVSGDDGSGYFLTNTGTDSEGYYRVMKFIGMNATATNLDFGSTKRDRSASLRCVSVKGERQDNSTFTYSCQVKGYTHVFLYHQAEDGTKTFLNTWPGKEVAIGTRSTGSMVISRYNPFSYTSYINLTDNGGRLFVIFNYVENGVIKNSSVTSEAINERQGTPFYNGDAYDYTFTTLSYKPTRGNLKDTEVGNEGNWKNHQAGATTQYKYAIKGTLDGSDSGWTTLGEMTYDSSSGTWVSPEISFTANSKFVIVQSSNSGSGWTSYKDWGKAPNTSTIVSYNTEYSLKAAAGNDSDNNYDFRFNSSSAGSGIVTLTVSNNSIATNSKIKVTRGTTTQTVSFALRLPFCDVEKTSSNAMRIVLVTKNTDGTENVMAAWAGTEMTKTSDGKYYYYKNNIVIEEGKTPADYMDRYLFVYGTSNNKTTNDDVKWSSGKHTGAITDATAKAACGNPDYLYTVWAVSESEPTPKTYLVVRVKAEDIYPDQEYLYAWTGSNSKPFGNYDDASFVSGTIGDYKYWRVESTSSSLAGVIFRNKVDREYECKSLTNVTSESDKSTYGATTLITVDASSYLSSNGYSGKYVNVKGDFNGWGNNGKVPKKNGGTVHELPIGNRGFKVHTDDGDDHWYSTGGSIEQGKWHVITGNSDNNMTISGASSGDNFRVEWDWNKKMIRVTKIN